MPTVQARRTLVKSPPELWAELSDVESLGRHLEPFGEIHITRLDPESSVAWEGERARGTVEIEASGWGTRVTLTAETDDSAPSGSAVHVGAVRAPSGDMAEQGARDEAAEAEAEAEVEALPIADGEPTQTPEQMALQGTTGLQEPVAGEQPPSTVAIEGPAPEQAGPPERESPKAGPGEPAPALLDEPLPQTTAALGQSYDLEEPPPLPTRGRWAPRRMFGWIARRPRTQAPESPIETLSIPAPEPLSQPEPAAEAITFEASTPAFEAPAVEATRVKVTSLEPAPPAERNGETTPEAPAPSAPPPEVPAPSAPPPEVPPSSPLRGPEPMPLPVEPDPGLDPAADAVGPQRATSEPREVGAEEAPSNANGSASGLEPDHLDEVLSAVLDDLGAAHHRPFSRG